MRPPLTCISACFDSGKVILYGIARQAGRTPDVLQSSARASQPRATNQLPPFLTRQPRGSLDIFARCVQNLQIDTEDDCFKTMDTTGDIYDNNTTVKPQHGVPLRSHSLNLNISRESHTHTQLKSVYACRSAGRPSLASCRHHTWPAGVWKFCPHATDRIRPPGKAPRCVATPSPLSIHYTSLSIRRAHGA